MSYRYVKELALPCPIKILGTEHQITNYKSVNNAEFIQLDNIDYWWELTMHRRTVVIVEQEKLERYIIGNEIPK